MGPGGRTYDDREGPRAREASLAALAGRQHGVVCVAELRQLGFTKQAVGRFVERHALLPMHRGVYAVGHAALTLDSRRMAAVLACGPEALLSHGAAGSLQGLLRSAERLEVTVPRGRKPKHGIVVHRSRLIHAEDRSSVRGIPVTSVARTLVDLADVLGEDRLARAIHEAEVLRVFDLRAIDRTLARLPGRHGAKRLRRVLASYRPEPRFLRSDAERALKRLCDAHSLPAPQFNVNLAGFEVDAYWEDVDVVIEVDGAQTHHTRRAFRGDRARDRRLASRGTRVVRLTWWDLRDEASLAGELREIRAAAARAAGSPPAPACA